MLSAATRRRKRTVHMVEQSDTERVWEETTVQALCTKCQRRLAAENPHCHMEQWGFRIWVWKEER